MVSDARLSVTSKLLFLAGPGALDDIRRNGFCPTRIGTIAGASGGAKWLVLSQIDRVIMRRILPYLEEPVHLLGSSIGAWRLACYAQASPLDALQRFETAYLQQEYTENPNRNEITSVSRTILSELLGPTGTREILSHPTLRSHVMTVRCRNLTSTDMRPLLAAGLMLAAMANALDRRMLSVFFSRALFHDPRDRPPFFHATGFPLSRVRLTEENFADVIMASGAIPLILSGVRNIDGAPPGIYRDGGVIDYHLDLPHSDAGKLTLFPHFFPYLVPGWFDKRYAWRKPDPAHTDRTILICPSPDFVASLPHGKIPDRDDFRMMSTKERKTAWQTVVASCQALAEDLDDVLDREKFASRLQPL